MKPLLLGRALSERKDGPTSLIFSRQNLPFMVREETNADDIARGAYILEEASAGKEQTEVVLLATGSEVALAAEVRKILTAENVQARLVSMPSTTVFDRQDEAYKTDVLGDGFNRSYRSCFHRTLVEIRQRQRYCNRTRSIRRVSTCQGSV